jgi:hypothetical protein
MDNFLAAALFRPEYVCKTFGFDQKAKLCRSMCFNEDGDQIWMADCTPMIRCMRRSE